MYPLERGDKIDQRLHKKCIWFPGDSIGERRSEDERSISFGYPVSAWAKYKQAKPTWWKPNEHEAAYKKARDSFYTDVGCAKHFKNVGPEMRETLRFLKENDKSWKDPPN